MGDSHMDTGFRNTSNVTEHDSPANDYYFNYYKFHPFPITAIVIDSVILVIGFPTICLAIYSLYRLVRSDMVVPIYIINLLISDLLQLITRPFNIAIKITNYSHAIKTIYNIFELLLNFGLSASVWFMVSIALERYLVVAHPLWYRCRRSIRRTALISGGVWLLALAFTAIYSMNEYIDNLVFNIIFPIFFLLPFPLLIFFFFGTKRAIAGATSVRDTEKRRILGTLAFVLGSYAVLFFPYCIVFFIMSFSELNSLYCAHIITLQIMELSVLVDPVLYILLRPDVRDTLGSVPCCQKLFTLTSCWTPRAEQQETEDAAAECPTEETQGFESSAESGSQSKTVWL